MSDEYEKGYDAGKEASGYEYAATITRLRSDLEKAREALRPLARFANVIDESEKTCGGEPSPDERAIHGELTVGHFRRAALTLKEIDNERT